MHVHGLLIIVALLIGSHSRTVNKRRVFPQICITTADCEGLNQVCVETIGLSGYGHCASKTEGPFISDMGDHNQDYSFLKIDLKETDGSGERVITDNLDEPPTKRKRDTEGIEHDTDDSGSSRHRIPSINISDGRMKRRVRSAEEKFKIILSVLHFDKRKNSEGKKTLTSLGKQFKQFLLFVHVNNVQKTKVNHHFKTHLKKRNTLDSDLKDNDTIDNEDLKNDDTINDEDLKVNDTIDDEDLKNNYSINDEDLKNNDTINDDLNNNDTINDEDLKNNDTINDKDLKVNDTIDDEGDNSNETNRTVHNTKENINKTVNKDEQQMNKKNKKM